MVLCPGVRGVDGGSAVLECDGGEGEGAECVHGVLLVLCAGCDGGVWGDGGVEDVEMGEGRGRWRGVGGGGGGAREDVLCGEYCGYDILYTGVSEDED